MADLMNHSTGETIRTATVGELARSMAAARAVKWKDTRMPVGKLIVVDRRAR